VLREEACEAALSGKDEVQDVHEAPRVEQPGQPPQDLHRCDVVNMMQEAVEQDEIEPPLAFTGVPAHVSGHEPAAVPAARGGEVGLVEVEAEIIGRLEVGRVRAGAAADVEHAARVREVVVLEHGRELLPCKGRLPQPIGRRAREDVRGPSHVRHRTRNRPTMALCGSRDSIAASMAGSTAPEKCGSRLITMSLIP